MIAPEGPLKYEEMLPLSRDEALTDLASGDCDLVSRALVRLALNDPERAFVEDIIAEHLESPDAWVRGVAALCVSHVARIHGALDIARFVPMLERLKGDERTTG